MSWIGLDWPEADEDLLREAGQKWIDFGNQLAQVSDPANATAQEVWSGTDGQASDAFRSWWTADDGPKQRLNDDAKAALLIGGALLAFAAITLMVKLEIIAQLISLAALVGQAIATAFFTFGATTAEVPGFIAASKIVIRKLIAKLVSHVQGEVRVVLDRARGLLRRARPRKLEVPRSARPDLPPVAGRPGPSFTAAETSALERYTGPGYRSLNEGLRGQRAMTPDLTRQADDLSSALGKLPDHSGTVWRGTRLEPEILDQYVPGEVVTEKAFTSTTKTANKEFGGNTLYTITSRTGKDVTPLSVNGHEDEVLFDKGTQFLVLDKKYDPATGRHLIQMAEWP